MIVLLLSLPGWQQIPQCRVQRSGDSICRGQSYISVATLNGGDIWLGKTGKFGEFPLRHADSLAAPPDDSSKPFGNFDVATLLLFGRWPSHDAIAAPRIFRT
jgi:hypothetical protein